MDIRHHKSNMPPTPIAMSQICLRPFDVGAALRLLLVPEDRFEPMSQALVTSTSAVHRAVNRLRHAGICKPASRSIDVDALVEFATCAVPYVFPAVRAGTTSGMPTAFAHSDWSSLSSGAETLVWPSKNYPVQGTALIPLFPGAPHVCMLDARMHRLLALVDAMRTARGEMRQIVRERLSTVLATLHA